MKSQSVQDAVRSRIATSREQLEKSLGGIISGRPLDAESSEVRKINRFQSVAGVSYEQAVKLANNDQDAFNELKGERRLGAERIQGKSVDFVGVSFLELARAAARTVGRVVSQDLRPVGSGFLVSDKLFLTNNHVIPSPEDAKQSFAEFQYELDVTGQPKTLTRFALDPEEFFVTNPEDQLDFTLVAIGKRVSGDSDLSDFGYSPLINSNDKHVLGEYVNIIQHPEGDFKQVVLRENQLVYRLDRFLEYMADTNPGSSGSPVYNDQWEVIALHHWGEPTQLKTPEGKSLQKDLNEGVRISSIFNELQSRRNSVIGEKRQLLEASLNSNVRYPTTLKESYLPSEKPSESQRYSDEKISDSIGEADIDSERTVTWKIPLEISVRLGNIIHPMTMLQTTKPKLNLQKEKEATVGSAEAVHIDRNYTNRSGYDPDFLPGVNVPLPVLNNAQMKDAAKNIQINHGQNSYEIKYHHFSIMINTKRLMAFFTAVNIDGSKWILVDRSTGEPSVESEAAEVWYEDPRINSTEQCHQDLYDHQRPRQFDRGHLVRRVDPNWGTSDDARKANADTFHFTNCTPQQWAFNEQLKYWAGIENYVLDNAKAELQRVSVFTGPIFTDSDPPYRYVKVPKMFWKILIRIEQVKLHATALLADQSKLLKTAESFNDLSKVAEYQTSVREIERLTGLDFGTLRDHDTFKQGPETLSTSKVELENFEQITL